MPHFRRQRGDRVDLLTVQFDRHVGGFVPTVSMRRGGWRRVATLVRTVFRDS
ncbi:DUF4304 domain-containing protein [Paraburkholderia sp. SIMBA_049]